MTTDTHGETVAWLREVDYGTDNACWVVCAKGDLGAVPFIPTLPRQLAEAQAGRDYWKNCADGLLIACEMWEQRVAEAQGVIERQRKALHRIAELRYAEDANEPLDDALDIADEALTAHTAPGPDSEDEK